MRACRNPEGSPTCGTRRPRRARLAALAFCLLAILQATVAAAETAIVRSGEHDGFTRLVVTLGRPVKWRFGRRADGYELSLDAADITYDLSAAFTRIARSRLADAGVDPQTGNLTLQMACRCHANAFEFRPGTVVIDIRPGPPVPGSAFERPLATATPPLPRPKARPRRAAEPTTGPETAFAPASLPAPPPGPMTLPTLPEPDVLAAREMLRVQLERAAAQGLVDVTRSTAAPPPHEAPPRPVAPAPPAPVVPATGIRGDGSGDGPVKGAPPHDAVREGGPGYGLRAETAFDAAQTARRTLRATVKRRHCPEGSRFDVAAWGDDRPAGEQISDRRNRLVGEFDRPAHGAVRDLARLYLYLGFGAEARATISAFPLNPQITADITELSEIVDDGRLRSSGPLRRFADCPGPVALWAVMAGPLDPGVTVATDMIRRTFSGLPPHLRRSLGPILAQRFLERGDADTAQAIRDAILRAPGDPGAGAALLDARFDLAAHDPARAEARIKPVVAEDGPLSAEAMVLLVQSRLDAKQPVAQPTIDALVALAHERRGAPLGPALIQAHALALASQGRFAEAFAELADSPATKGIAVATARLWQMLATNGSDEALLRLGLRPPGPVASLATRRAIADRLLGLGFPGPALDWIASAETDGPRDHLRRARAAIALDDGRTALREIAALDAPARAGDQAQTLRAQALALLGRHETAAAAFAAAGDADASRAEYWRAGDWSAIATDGDEVQKKAIAVSILPAPQKKPAGTTEAAGPLQQGRALVEDSRNTRRALQALLATLEPPAPSAR